MSGEIIKLFGQDGRIAKIREASERIGRAVYERELRELGRIAVVDHNISWLSLQAALAPEGIELVPWKGVCIIRRTG